MRNLAGDEHADASIRDELGAAGIPLVESGARASHPDVKTRYTGRLGPFTFWRAWYYWNVSGPVPLAVARELYADPVGRQDVRVDGHCGCPAPEAPWVRYVGASGKKRITPKSAGHPRPIDWKGDEAMAAIYAKIDRDYEIVDDPAAGAAACFVDCYHIDSGAGLRLFVDTVRRAGLTGEAVQYRDEGQQSLVERIADAIEMPAHEAALAIARKNLDEAVALAERWTKEEQTLASEACEEARESAETRRAKEPT